MNEEQAQGVHVISDQRGRKYIMLDEPDGVVVLAKKEEAFLLIRQYRPAVDAVVVQLLVPATPIPSGSAPALPLSF